MYPAATTRSTLAPKSVLATSNMKWSINLATGTFGQWLVHPLGVASSYFALKVLRADVDNANELSVLWHLQQVSGPGHPNLVVLYDSFRVSSLNGEHRCLVFPVLGPSLSGTVVLDALTGPVRHRVCQQLVSAVVFLHGHDICHGGKLQFRIMSLELTNYVDITSSNIVFELPDAPLDQFLGLINVEKLKLGNGSRSQHAPVQVIQALELSGFD